MAFLATAARTLFVTAINRDAYKADSLGLPCSFGDQNTPLGHQSEALKGSSKSSATKIVNSIDLLVTQVADLADSSRSATQPLTGAFRALVRVVDELLEVNFYGQASPSSERFSNFIHYLIQ